MTFEEAIHNIKKWLACINRDDLDCLRMCDSCKNHVDAVTLYESLTVIVAVTYTNIPHYMLCKCSACGADILVPYAGKNIIFNYCPNCGAKMEGDLT